MQREAAFSQKAAEFEAPNAIGGGFGGGFGGSGGGFFSIPPVPDATVGAQEDEAGDEGAGPAEQVTVPAADVPDETVPIDALAVKQLQAADVIG